MSVVSVICAVLLGLTGLVCMSRIVRGPTMLDRTVASDVFVAATVGALAVWAAVRKDTNILPILVSLSFVAFMGSVAIARYTKPEAPGPENQSEVD
ncbi:MAG: cation:proton antiporter [Actinomycetales bacterium]|nr:cation:proton antiporter [Actinomycetales bacterium]